MGPIMRRTSLAPHSNPRRNTLQLKDKLKATSMYSSRESEVIQDVLKFLALRVPGCVLLCYPSFLCLPVSRSIQFLFECIDKSEQPAFGAALINASFAKNFTFPMLQDLLYDEFESNSSPGKEILRENGIVIQFLKAYLRILSTDCSLLHSYLPSLSQELLERNTWGYSFKTLCNRFASRRKKSPTRLILSKSPFLLLGSIA